MTFPKIFSAADYERKRDKFKQRPYFRDGTLKKSTASKKVYKTLHERFWSKVRKTKICWLWIGAVSEGGYGGIQINKKRTRAHRYSWEITNGPIPAGLMVLHRCNNPSCVRPSHLKLGNHRQNMIDRIKVGGRNGNVMKDYCKRGHEFSGENVRYSHKLRDGKPVVYRHCKTCKTEMQRKRRSGVKLVAEWKAAE